MTHPTDTSHPMKRLYYSGFAGGGVAIGDVDNDRRPDLFITSGPGGNRLYRQTGDLRFEDVTARAGVSGGESWGAGSAMVDIDADGDLDLYVCNYDSPNQLYLNQGDGRFVEGAAERGLDCVDACLTPAFCDFDGDGDLDLYVLTNRYYREGGRPAASPVESRGGRLQIKPQFRKYYGLWRQPNGRVGIEEVGRPDRLLRNNGDGSFTDVTQDAGVGAPGNGLSVAWWDYDDDGAPDLYVANDFNDPDHLYRNNGDGTFTDVLREAVPHTPWFSMGSDVGDINNDGHLDFMVVDMAGIGRRTRLTTMGAITDERLRAVSGPPPQVMRNALYVNSGAGRFLEGARLAGLAESDWSWAVKLADYDNDGRLDVAITNGVTRSYNDSDIPFRTDMLVGRTMWDVYEDTPPRPEQNRAFRNLGDLRFEDASHSWGFDHVGMSYAAAHGDLDRDGDLDLVVVNLNEPVSIYRNESSAGRRLLIRLRGGGANTYGIGARVTIETASGVMVRELSPQTGFLSSNEPLLHFGLGDESRVRSLRVAWPSGRVQEFHGLDADQCYTITEPAGASRPADKPARATMFKQTRALAPLRHFDKPFDDYRVQPLLPQKLSQLGPGVAWGDVDADGDDDLYFGQGAGTPGVLMINLGTGDFMARHEPFRGGKASEDMGALFFDADNDLDLDLYVASGDYGQTPGAPELRDRLYLNDGSGHFAGAPEGTLPDLRDSSGCVVAADYDRDGDLDLFVGGRLVPGEHPLTPASRLLRNDGGRFVDVTDAAAPGLSRAGLVTGALWSDADGDGWLDLLVTREWGPVGLWRNVEGRLEERTSEAGLERRTGWWSSIAGRDLDGDQDIDYVVANAGLNTKHQASREEPLQLFYGDPDGLGRNVLIEAAYERGVLFPTRGKSALAAASPLIEDRFPTHLDFASAPLDAVFSPTQLNKGTRLSVNCLASGVLVNDGSGKFQFAPLPRLAQIAPTFGVGLTELDGDGHADLCLAQNNYALHPETGRADGGVGLLLTGAGDGRFSTVWPDQSGLITPGDARSLTIVDLNNDAWPDLVVALNNDEVKTFENRGSAENRVLTIHLRGSQEKPVSCGARVTLKTSDGRTQTAETHSGSGYLSQSTGALAFGLGESATVEVISVRWPDGQTTQHTTATEHGRLELTRP
ncbi:FG-GAP-like repeat-containing protein [Posidoniimonas polymericola]|nr:FG-GAP-like repeat-containing protein [Posidoniimonas polymericola]